MNSNIISVEQDSLNFHANGENFSIVISKLKALHIYLNDNPSSKCQDDYLSTMAFLLEHYLDSKKQLFLRNHLGEIIVENIEDNGAIKYFKKRLAKAKILDLLKYHHNITKKRLFLTEINYDNQEFKVKII